jgi:putative membrane protein (TIGR04086 family)
MDLKPKGSLGKFADNMSANYGMAWDVGVGALGAFITALVYVAVFAGCIKLFRVNENVIPIVNQVAKVACMLFGSWLSVRKRPAKGWLRGGLAGLLYVLLAFVLFSAIDGDWSFGWAILSDLLMGAAVGGIGGIIFVNLKKK